MNIDTIFDVLETKSQQIRGFRDKFYLYKIYKKRKKVNKGVRRMPWLSEAKKDVISCDKLRILANTN
jgi:hypothetical protein